MLRKLPLKIKFLAISIICALLIVGINFFYTYYSTRSQQSTSFAKEVSSKVQIELQKAQIELDALQSRIMEAHHINFTNIVKQTQYPYFVYKDHKLLFWSDYRVSSDYSYLEGNYKEKLVSLRNNKFLVKKQKFVKNKKTYELFYLIPLTGKPPILNQYLKNKPNTSIFAAEIVSVSNFPSEEQSFNIYSENDLFLFSIDFSDTHQTKPVWLVSIIFILLALCLSSWIVFFYLQYRIFLNSKQRISAIAWVSGGTIFTRILMMYFNIPSSITPLKIFNSKYFAFSNLLPTIGDFLLDYSCLAVILAAILYNFNFIKLTRRVYSLPTRTRQLLSFVVIVIFYLNYHWTFETIRTNLMNAQWNMDITQDISFNQFKLVSIFLFMLSSFCFFVISHILCRIYTNLNIGNSEIKQIGVYLITNILIALVAYLNGTFEPLLFLAYSIYFVIQVEFKLSTTIRQLEFKTYLYFIIVSIVCSFSAALATYRVYQQKDFASKDSYGTNILAPNDVYGEYLLNVANEEIEKDGFIKSRLSSIFPSKDVIEQKIRKHYLSSYFDQYEVQIRIFDTQGFEIGSHTPETTRFNDLQGRFASKKYATEYQGLYLINDNERNLSRNYVQFIKIGDSETNAEHVVIELNLKKIIPNSIYPTLLVDKKFSAQTQNKNYSYAIYENDTLVFCAGNFNYGKNIGENLKELGIGSDGTFDYKNFSHQVKTISKNKLIVVSSPIYSLTNVFSNFSFYLLILIVLTLMIMAFYTYYYYKRSIQLNFVTKIQLYLSGVLFFTLLIISMAILGAISSSYKTELSQNFSKRAGGISNNIAEYFDNYKKGRITEDNFSKLAFELSRVSETDINFFDARGKLSYTSQPMIYEFGLFSYYLNPEVYSSLIELKNNLSIVNESIGELQYKNIYTAVKSFDTGELIGVLSLPFFESASELETQLISVITTIINIFVSVFLILLVFSFFISRYLTYPLTLLRNGLQKISLQNENEALQWNSTDEIGILVNEYNNMLSKLVESKKQLAQQEKESAWRVMAQQVAHEIKNPLTPMKLSLQYLDKTIKENRDNVKGITEKTIHSMLTQIDTLSDIATSFSTFAKMPIPQYESYDLVKTSRETVHLHANQEIVDVLFETNIEIAEVMGDQKLMGRIITNLLINAIQSIPTERVPEIKVYIQANAEMNKVVLAVKDNGNGIPEEIIDKVFIPNFSTKYNGSGIGLAVAKNGVQHAGGKIWFETEKDKGTCFFIELPLINNLHQTF